MRLDVSFMGEVVGWGGVGVGVGGVESISTCHWEKLGRRKSG